MNDFIDVKELEYTHIGKHCKLEGTFFFSGKTFIHSHLKGNISVDKDSTIIFEGTSFFEGELKGSLIEIYGIFNGTIDSTGSVIIHPTANISGKIKAKSLIIHPGATVNFTGDTED